MSRHITWALFASSCTLLALACYAPTTHAGGWGVFTPPTTDMEKLACHIDKLEKHIDEYGSVVAKSPDVWGEARLTKYRKVVEKQLAGEEGEFKFTMNGAISRSDQAFLTSALAIQAALGGPQAVTTAQSGVVSMKTEATSKSDAANSSKHSVTDNKTSDTAEKTNSSSDSMSSNSSNEDKLTTTPQAIPAGAVEDPVSDLKISAVGATTVNFGSATTISLEPTTYLNQLNRYLQHLNQLRRINDGDDTSDSPGYALHLVRIPISVLPGKKTEEGYGAEVTITAKPHLHEKLLPVTFRQLVINDVMDQLSFPLAKFLDSEEGQKALKKLDELTVVDEEDKKASHYISPDYINKMNPIRKQNLLEALELTSVPVDQKVITERVEYAQRQRVAAADDIQKILSQIVSTLSIQPYRRATLPVPSSRLLAVYGFDESKVIHDFFKRIKFDPLHSSSVVTLDLQKLLNQEIAAAYEFLIHHPELWNHVTHDLADAIHGHRYGDVALAREAFLSSALSVTNHSEEKEIDGIPFRQLAWGIIVESALLNERLIEDMKEISTAKNCLCLDQSWLHYYLPEPPPEAVHNFNEYVRCRWPVHVFAVDPVTEDQNIADSFAQRREMQLALSLAFASGRINAQKFMRYVRQTSLDVDTIALNRTVIGFSHGDDTFGWRFYPRVQTPRTPGNATVVFRDMLYGGLKQEQLLRQRRLEPGQRECTALVIMPSFVPYCVFDMRSNWFKLANPAHKELDLRDGVALSEDITTLRQLSTRCIEGADRYRPEDLHHLTRAVEQLERRLPLQTKFVQIPYENTLGGFEFFNTGVTDLAPEVRGFYGEPGIDTSKETTIFVVGDHFSVHETQVVVGNLDISSNNFELLSRQVMKVKIPANANTYSTKDAAGKPLELVDLHVATPYGVSNHLSIPVIKSAAQTQAKAAADAAKAEVAKALVASGISYKWKQDAPINVTYCTNNPALSINFSNSDIDPTTTRQIISDSPQSSIFDPTPEPQLAVIVTGLDADGKAIPGQQWTYTPDFVYDSAAQSGPIAFELSVSVPGAPGSPLTLTLPTRKILQNIQASLAGSVLTPQAPAALHLQGYLRFGGDGAPIMALTNNLLIKLSPINCATPCIPGTTSNLNSLFTPVATSSPQPPLPLANTPQSKPTLADRYRTPQQATITPPLIAQ